MASRLMRSPRGPTGTGSLTSQASLSGSVIRSGLTVPAWPKPPALAQADARGKHLAVVLPGLRGGRSAYRPESCQASRTPSGEHRQRLAHRCLAAHALEVPAPGARDITLEVFRPAVRRPWRWLHTLEVGDVESVAARRSSGARRRAHARRRWSARAPEDEAGPWVAGLESGRVDQLVAGDVGWRSGGAKRSSMYRSGPFTWQTPRASAQSTCSVAPRVQRQRRCWPAVALVVRRPDEADRRVVLEHVGAQPHARDVGHLQCRRPSAPAQQPLVDLHHLDRARPPGDAEIR